MPDVPALVVGVVVAQVDDLRQHRVQQVHQRLADTGDAFERAQQRQHLIVGHRDHVVVGDAVVVRGGRQLDGVVDLIGGEIPVGRVYVLDAQESVEVGQEVQRVL